MVISSPQHGQPAAPEDPYLALPYQSATLPVLSLRLGELMRIGGHSQGHQEIIMGKK